MKDLPFVTSQDSPPTESPDAGTLLERHVQDFLSKNLSLLNIPRLQLMKTEYPLSIGRVDILASTAAQELYAIEIKRGSIERQDVGQIQSYMGALIEEFPGATVYGLLVGQELSSPAKHALAVTSRIGFVPFQVQFAFGTVPSMKDRSSVWNARNASPTLLPNAETRRCWQCHERVAPLNRKGALICPQCQNEM